MYAQHKVLLFVVLGCLGQSAHGSEIINGEKAPENSMQYMASLQKNGRHVCGGFLIHQDFVLTAAHCDVSSTHVVLGTHNLNEAHEKNIRYIEHTYKPKDYVSEGNGNDIMLVKLAQKAQLDNKVQTVQLPTSTINLKENDLCTVAGWGFTVSGGQPVADLRVVKVPIINPEKCNEIWRGLPANVICAGGYGTNKGFCQGDSGGPLVCNNMAVGIVSFNSYRNCKYPDVPNVYTDISKYLPWINKILIKKMY